MALEVGTHAIEQQLESQHEERVALQHNSEAMPSVIAQIGQDLEAICERTIS